MTVAPQRPVYVGIGSCACGRGETTLYIAPMQPISAAPMCRTCCEARGADFPVPRTRTRPISYLRPVAPMVHVGKLELGLGHTFEAVIGQDDCLIGWLHTHIDARRDDESELCQSFCAVRPINSSPVHQVICADPLTLTPSLKCRMCGVHGEVINGKWEPR